MMDCCMKRNHTNNCSLFELKLCNDSISPAFGSKGLIKKQLNTYMNWFAICKTLFKQSINAELITKH